MKNHGLRLFSLVAALACAAAGCAGAPSSGVDSKAASSQQPPGSAAPREPVTIRYLGTAGQGSFPEGMDENNNPIADFIKEQTGYGIDLKFPGTPEERNAILASGEVYDIVRLPSTVDIGQFYAQGMLAPLDDYLPAAARIREQTPAATWGAGAIEGKQYAIPVLYASPYWGMGVRTDWMERLSIQPPTTIDAFYSMLRAFTKDDPDGNGKDDTIGITMYGNDVGWVNSYGVGGFGSNFFWSLFDLPNEYFVREGEVVYAPVTENAKQMLLFLNRLWKEGILDKEFAINNPAKLSEKIIGSKAGALDITYWHLQDWSGQLKETAGADVFATIPPPRTYEGKEMKYRVVGPVDSYRVILKNSPHKAEAVAFLDQLLDPEVTAVTTFGFEGEHWNRSGDSIELTEQYGAISYLWYYRDGLYFSKDMMDQVENAEYGACRSDNKAWTGGEETWSVLNIIPPMPERQETLMEVRELVDKRLLQFIVGEKDIEAEFQSYVDEWKAAGGDVLLAAINQSYQSTKK